MAANPLPLFEPLYAWHVALVTRRIDEMVERLWNDFGIGPWQYVKFEFDKADARVYGKPAALSIQAAVTQVGYLTLGFDQPLNTPDPYSEMLDARGGGAHHLAFAIAEENGARQKMRSLGHGELLAGDGIGPSREGQASYFDTQDALGTYIELSKVPAELPPMGRVYPDPAEIPGHRSAAAVRSTSHIAIVVRDAARTVANFERMLGIGPWQVATATTSAVFRGARIDYSVKTATATVGDYVLVLEQPVSAGGPLAEFLDRNDQGIHRLAFVVDSLDAAAKELATRGYTELLRTEPSADRAAVVVFDSERITGVTIELREAPVR